MPLALLLVGLILALVELVRTRGQALLPWAVLCLALGLTWGRVL